MEDKMAFDRLIENIVKMQNPTVAGLDPKLDYVPASIREKCFEKYVKTSAQQWRHTQPLTLAQRLLTVR